jgi:hypothetical protein
VENGGGILVNPDAETVRAYLKLQREFFDLISERLNLPRVDRKVPFRLAWRAASVLETVFRAIGRRTPPPFTRRALLMLSRPTRFSIDKADRDLGWRPEVPIREGLADALAWNQELQVAGAVAR